MSAKQIVSVKWVPETPQGEPVPVKSADLDSELWRSYYEDGVNAGLGALDATSYANVMTEG